MSRNDEWGDFLEAYEAYFNGELEYGQLPSFGRHKVEPPTEATCERCLRQFMRKKRLVDVCDTHVTWGMPTMCSECVELASSGPPQPLPVARVINRRK